MYEPLAWTASTICGRGISEGEQQADVNDTNFLPGFYLGISVNIWDVPECPGGGVNQGCLSDQKGSRECGALGIIFHPEFCVNVIIARSSTGEGGEDDPM